MDRNSSLSNIRFDRSNAIIAGIVWLIAMTIYGMTKAPTLSFWDCGEFIAAAGILGVPHPPGSALYILVGRIFSLLPIAEDIAVRINLLSGVCSAFAAMFGYLIVVRLLRGWFADQGSLFNRAIIYAGAASGALFAAFSLTNWNNSVEAEVYGMAMMMMFAIIWLGLVYHQHAETTFGQKIMMLAVFIGVLGIGVHMVVYMAVPIAGLFFVLRKDAPNWVWFAVAIFFALELYLIFALSSPPGEVAFYVPIAIVALFYFLYMFSYERVPRYQMFIALGFVLSLAPLFGDLLARFTGADGLKSPFEILGAIAFIATNLGAVLLLNRYRQFRNEENAARHLLAPGAFVIAATVLVLLLMIGFDMRDLPESAYKAFLLGTVVLAGVFGWIIRQHLRWDILIVLAAASTVIIGVVPFFYALAVATLIITLLGLANWLPNWRNALLVLLAAIMGFSVNLFIPIRARENPAINENDPTTVSATIDFLDRKQYGQTSMFERMFKRRAEWENQFGNHRRMGFWGFFHEQYGLKGQYSVLFILVGLFGAWEVVRRRPKGGVVLSLLLLLASVGLILYMNFSDGTRQQILTGPSHLEVRDRDYFFTPAFMIFGLAIGIGLTFLVSAVRDAVARLGGAGKAITALVSLVFLSPVIAGAGNYHIADRSGNYIPYDYGQNLLMSAEENSILFTHGDNDTFPLWCLQEVYGFRTDVKVVNLSLANTHWYIKQVRSSLGLELPWTDEQIMQLRPQRIQGGGYYRLQDAVVDALIDRYYGERPVYFSVTVGGGARRYRGQPLDDRLTMHGMLFEVQEPHGGINVDVDYSLNFFENLFRARGVNDPDVYKDEATERLTRNYGNAFLMVADTIRRAGDYETAERLVAEAWRKVPYAGDLPDFLASLYSERGKVEKLAELIESSDEGNKKWMKVLLGRAYMSQGDTTLGIQALENLIRTNPGYRTALDELMRIQYARRNMEGIKNALRLWIELNPDDRQMAGALRQLESGMTIEDLDAQGAGQ